MHIDENIFSVCILDFLNGVPYFMHYNNITLPIKITIMLDNISTIYLTTTINNFPLHINNFSPNIN